MHKIILADSQSIFRAGAAKMFSVEDDFHIIAHCSDAEQLGKVLASLRGVTVLFSSALKQKPERLMEQIRARDSRGIAILEDGEPPESFLAARVDGLFFRSITRSSLIQAVRRVTRGERVFQMERNPSFHSEDDTVGARVRDQLTVKEMKIVALIVKGCRNREIARRLGTTEQVIKNSLGDVYDKAGVSDRMELALFTLHHRILAEAAAEVGSLLKAS